MRAMYPPYRSRQMKEIALSILGAPQQKTEESAGLKSYQSKILFGNKTFLVRLIVNEQALLVVTVYRTSKIEKYWRSKS